MIKHLENDFKMSERFRAFLLLSSEAPERLWKIFLQLSMAVKLPSARRGKRFHLLRAARAHL